MIKPLPPPATPAEQILWDEIARLTKIIDALMDRAESSAMQSTDYDSFRTTILLEDLVQKRTTEMKRAVQEKEKLLRDLWASEARFRGIVNLPMVGIAILEEGRFTFINPKLAEIFGYQPCELLDKQLLNLVSPADQPMVTEQMRRRVSGEVDRVAYVFRGLRKNGAIIHVDCHSSILEIEGRKLLIGLMSDITDRVRAEESIRELQERLREMAFHDPLTGLFNRQPLNELFDREIGIATRYDRSLAVVMGDIDWFKKVNDQFGHLAGDEVLKHFAHQIQVAFRATDIFCRFGGEEFLILLPDATLTDAVERAEWMREVIADTPALYGSTPIPITASFGVSVFPAHGRSRAELIEAADRALYSAKAAGRNRVMHAPEPMP